jgi:hypothetical protein
MKEQERLTCDKSKREIREKRILNVPPRPIQISFPLLQQRIEVGQPPSGHPSGGIIENFNTLFQKERKGCEKQCVKHCSCSAPASVAAT